LDKTQKAPQSAHLCTLPHGCFEHSENAYIPTAIGKHNATNTQSATTQHLIISKAAVSTIHNMFQHSTAPSAFLILALLNKLPRKPATHLQF